MAFGADISETLGNVGNRTTTQGYNKPDEIRKQYAGYERDDESGLDFAQARYYNSSHGRFTSVDPLTASANVKDPQTFNRYMYAMNSPYKFTDPLGLISSSTGACGQWCQGSGDYLDGSEFRGTDTTFDHLRTQSQDPPPPPPQTGILTPDQRAARATKELGEKQASKIFGNSIREASIATFAVINVSISTIFKSIPVSGNDAAEAILNSPKAIKENTTCGDTGGACTVPDWRFNKTKLGFNISFDLSVYLPQWISYLNAPTAERLKWDGYLHNLKQHERVHVAIFGLFEGFLKNKIPANIKSKVWEHDNFKHALKKITVINDAWDELDEVYEGQTGNYIFSLPKQK